MPKPVTPYQDTSSGKKEQISKMFDNIASRYDFLNHFLSGGIDFYWRKKGIRMLGKALESAPEHVLDVATGTGDLAIEALHLKPRQVTGVDIAAKMLAQGRTKLQKKGLTERIQLKFGDSEALQYPDATFDAVTVAFGVRNFENVDIGLQEMLRVLKPGGWALILEFSRPVIFPVKQLFHLYFRYVLPWIGWAISNDKAAYHYLPTSVRAFPQREALVEILHQNGFIRGSYQPLTFGICTAYLAQKPQ